MFVSALSTYAWFLFSAVVIRSGGGATPPDKFVLLSTVCFGWLEPPDENFVHAIRVLPHREFGAGDVHPFATLNINALEVSNFPNACAYSPDTNNTECIQMPTEEGTYIARWNITYIISADPSKANETYCGPPPYSSQSFFFNSTWETSVDDGWTSQTLSPEISTATFTTEPTGSVRKLSGAEGSWRGWSMRNVVATAGIAGASMMI